MVKQPAWPAATSSSGFVPLSLSNRVLKEYGAFSKTPESVEMFPAPDRPFPTPNRYRFAKHENLLSKSTVHLPLEFLIFPAPDEHHRIIVVPDSPMERPAAREGNAFQ